jgi:hypothetical protein
LACAVARFARAASRCALSPFAAYARIEASLAGDRPPAIADVAALVPAVTGGAEAQAWDAWLRATGPILHGRDALTAGDIRALRRAMPIAPPPRPAARSTREAMSTDAARAAWAALPPWQQQLWREYTARHGDRADVTVAGASLLSADCRLGMALTMAPDYMAGGAGEALRELVSDPSFLSVAALGISVYFALAFAPEPLFTKAPVVLTTLGLMASAAVTAREIVATAGAWLALQEATDNARTLAEIEVAAANFGRSIGATGGRILVALASIVAGHALRATFAGSGSSVAAGGSSLVSAPAAAGHGSMSAVAVMFKARPVVGVSAVVVPTSMAMAAHAGRDVTAGGSAAGRGAGSGSDAAERLIHFGGGVRADAAIFHSKIKPAILKAAGKYQGKVGKNPDIKVVGGNIHLQGTGPFKGKTFKTGLKASDFFGINQEV